jgi:uncharacterized protein (DUF1697 family)
MSRYVTFLRAVNVGGHVIKMDTLRFLFAQMGFSQVETFIASGNVAFTTPSPQAEALERKIERRLNEALGYAVATFIRTEAELAEIVRHQPFAPEVLAGAVALNIAFLHEAPDKEAQQKLMALRTDIDDFAVHGREIYWLCRKKQSESTFSNAVLEKTLGRPSTLRGAATLQKMAALPKSLPRRAPAPKGRNR